MGRWRHHPFRRCHGYPFRADYTAPHSLVLEKGPIDVMMQVADEARFGVTLLHYRCIECGKHFTNRRLGDARSEVKNDD